MIISPVESVDQLYWPKRVTGRAIKADSVVVIPSGGQHDLMIVKLANGGFISSRDISKYAYLPGQYPWMDSTIKALVKLGAITAQAASDHMAVCARNSERNQAKYNAESLSRLAKETGLKLSAEQKAYVAKHGKAQ
jgi:hypothetical protein